jgi:phage tail sheath gpL-like
MSTSRRLSALPLLRAAATNVTQVSSLIVSGVFASGDVIVFTGISEEPLVYTVVQADLQGPSGAGLSLEQATRNVAGQLRALINSNSDATVVAGGSGAVIQLEAKDSGSEGAFHGRSDGERAG